MTGADAQAPLLVSGFYTGVDDDRHRIFRLHQSYAAISGAAARFVYCTGAMLAEEHRIADVTYIQSSLAQPSPVRTLVAMARESAYLAMRTGQAWFVATHGDVWGAHAGWAPRIITLGLSDNPDAELI